MPSIQVLLPLLLVALFGAVLGSFLGVLVDRLPKGKTVLGGRSKCASCNKTLAARDMIPILSYILLGGRCRNCHARIPPHLFMIEVISACVAVGLWTYVISLGYSPLLFIFLLVIMLSLVGIIFADSIYGIIPDEFTGAIVIASLFTLFLFDPSRLFTNFITGAISFLIFFTLYFATSGRGMGFGDVKLSFAAGFLLGFPKVIPFFYFAFLTAMIVSIILVLSGRKSLRGGIIAFGPYMALGAIFSYFWGDAALMIFFR